MLTKALLYLAGADPKRFDGIEHERTRYVALGAAMLVPSVIGGISIFISSMHFGNSPTISVILAGTWSVVIVTIDRALVVTTLRRLPGERFRFVNLCALFFRILLAGLVGLAIGFFAKLALSADTAKQELADEIRQKTMIAEQPLLRDLARADISIANAGQEAEVELAEAGNRLSEALAARTTEAQGIGGSRRYGDQGPGYRAADAEVRERQAGITLLQAQWSERQTVLRGEHERIAQQLAELRKRIAASASNDLFAQVHALYRVLLRYPYLWWFTAFFAAFLLLLELIPVVVKAIVVRDSAYAFRDRMASWLEEERLRIEIEAYREAHARRVALRAEFIVGEAESEAYDQWDDLASKHSESRSRDASFSFRPTPPDNATRSHDA